MEHERHVTNGHSLAAAYNVDRRDVVGEPVFRLRSTVVLGGVPWEREPAWELLGPDARSEAAVGSDIFLLDEG